MQYRQLIKLSKGFQSVGSRLKALTKSIFSLKTALVGVAGVAGFGYLVKSSLNSADALAKTASKIGTTTEALSKAALCGMLSQALKLIPLTWLCRDSLRRTAEAAAGNR